MLLTYLVLQIWSVYEVEVRAPPYKIEGEDTAIHLEGGWSVSPFVILGSQVLQDVNTKLATMHRNHFERQMCSHRSVVNLPSSENIRIQFSVCFIHSHCKLKQVWACWVVLWIQYYFLFSLSNPPGQYILYLEKMKYLWQNNKDFPPSRGPPIFPASFSTGLEDYFLAHILVSRTWWFCSSICLFCGLTWIYCPAPSKGGIFLVPHIGFLSSV